MGLNIRFYDLRDTHGTLLLRQGIHVKVAHFLTKNVLQSASLPQIRKYSKDAELLALHMGEKEGGDGGPVDAREASDQQGDGAALPARQ